VDRRAAAQSLVIALLLLVDAALAAGRTGRHAVQIEAQDGVVLAGTLYGSGRIGVVLAPGHGARQTEWQPFALELAERGFAALTYEMRGQGDSHGAEDPAQLGPDAAAAIELLRQHGADRIVCIGAGLGGTACVLAAASTPIAALAMLSGPEPSAPPVELTPGDLGAVFGPRLFLASAGDQPATAELERLAAGAGGPRQVRIFPGTARGAGLLEIPEQAAARALLLGLVQGLADPFELLSPEDACD
jgi:pimeloyl-ACP methyl ester carboxylesterase